VAQPIYMKDGNTKRDLVLQLIAADGTVPDITAISSVTIKLKPAGGVTVSLTGAVHDAPTGKVRWRPAANQSDYVINGGLLAPGRYEGQVYIAHADSREETFPDQGNFILVIEAQL